MHPMRRLMELSQGQPEAAKDEMMPHFETILKCLQDGPKSPNECKAGVRDFLALAHPNYIRPVEGEKTVLTSKDCRWQLTPLGFAYLNRIAEVPVPVTEDAPGVNRDGEDSPFTRKRKRPRDPSSQKWFKELFSKRG